MASPDPPSTDHTSTVEPDGSRVRKPGTRGGLAHILHDVFGLSPTSTLDRDEVVRRVVEALARRDIRYDVLYISDAPVHRGALFDAARRRVAFPEGDAYERCVVVLVDPDQRARWAHDAWWAFVPADGEGEVALRETTLPEHPRGPVRLERLP